MGSQALLESPGCDVEAVSEKPCFHGVEARQVMQRRLGWIVAGLVLLGLAARVRLYAGCASYWYDEAYILLNIFNKSWVGLLGHLQDDQAGPPVYFWCLRALYLIGGSAEWVMRLPAFAAGLAGLGVMGVAARRLLPHSGWLWAVGWCAVCTHAGERGAEVKPYTWDFLATLLILLAADRLLEASTCRQRRGAWGWLAGLAMLAPWCSLPSVFVLGGVSLALLYRAVRSRARGPYLAWASFSFVCLVSSGCLYLLVLQHQRTPGLTAYWAGSFGDCSSPARLLRWMGGCLTDIGNYGSNGLGIPLVVLALVGGAFLGRRSPGYLLLLAGPIVLAMTASLLHCYPLADRLTFFLVPCLFLLAGEGAGTLAEACCTGRCPYWLAWLGVSGLTLLLLPGAGPTTQMAVVSPDPAFREAFAYAREHRRWGDILWVSHPQVFQVYFRDHDTCLGSYDDPEEVVDLARGQRIWVIAARYGSDELEHLLRSAGFTMRDEYRLHCHDVRMYEQADRNGTPPSSLGQPTGRDKIE